MNALSLASPVAEASVERLASVKRFLERWMADPGFRRGGNSFERVYEELELDLPSDIPRYFRAFAGGTSKHGVKKPDLICAYEKFYTDTFLNRRNLIRESGGYTPAFEAWRNRQIDRTNSEVDGRTSSWLAHVPVAIELSDGCSVGCWFCSVSAAKLTEHYRYTDTSAETWRSVLQELRDTVGRDARFAMLYWATDPLDNPDYEQFCRAFAEITGTFPSTTTALALRDPQRTRQLLAESARAGSSLNRFSVLSIKELARLHREFTPLELANVEVIPQNEDSLLPKSIAGRARLRIGLSGSASAAAPLTNACVSGFLINMVSGSIKLISPCNASDETPLGYLTLGEDKLAKRGGLSAQLAGMLAN